MDLILNFSQEDRWGNVDYSDTNVFAVKTMTKSCHTTFIQNAYMDWTMFMEEMMITKLDGIPSKVDWRQLGNHAFPWVEYAATIQRKRFQCKATQQIHNRYVYCIRGLMLLDYLKRYVNANPTSEDPYIIAYQYLPFSKLSLRELQTTARLNYVVSNGDKFELAVAIRQSQKWGFNTFAMNSRLNDNVLSRIRSFVRMTPHSLKQK
jgi:hypothetical protein